MLGDARLCDVIDLDDHLFCSAGTERCLDSNTDFRSDTDFDRGVRVSLAPLVELPGCVAKGDDFCESATRPKALFSSCTFADLDCFTSDGLTVEDGDLALFDLFSTARLPLDPKRDAAVDARALTLAPAARLLLDPNFDEGVLVLTCAPARLLLDPNFDEGVPALTCVPARLLLDPNLGVELPDAEKLLCDLPGVDGLRFKPNLGAVLGLLLDALTRSTVGDCALARAENWRRI